MTGRPIHLVVATVALLSVSAGCAKQGMYRWETFEDSLYELYRTPESRPEYVAALQRVVRVAGEKGTKIPPGICAEYGYAHFVDGDIDGAIMYWKRERELWPESAFLMDSLIANAGQKKPDEPTADQENDEGRVMGVQSESQPGDSVAESP